jgi:hypothetical protein
MATTNEQAVQASRTAEAFTDAGLVARIAGNSYGEPVCIGPADHRDEGLGVTLYTAGGEIVGVVVTGQDDNGFPGYVVAEYGLTPSGNEED